jgi:nitroimidazol reductase NimA-like FMN-containing flavoprotein (pyridoxamine 5'-phosphate oxidase superfamily)
MTVSTEQASGHVHTLSEERCRELLGSHHEGRIAWTAADGPQLLPVSYTLYDGQVAFRTSPYGALAQFAGPTMVAFEIDDIEPVAGVGWSVLVRGRAEPVTRAFPLATLWADQEMTPWASGTRNLVVLIEEHSISGCQLKAPYAD